MFVAPCTHKEKICNNLSSADTTFYIQCKYVTLWSGGQRRVGRSAEKHEYNTAGS
jgi:hypothetical protein